MSKQKMLAAKELIQEKRYDEARMILKTVDHPTAKLWLEKLDKIAPQKQSSNRKGRRNTILAIITIFLAVFAVVFANSQQNQKTSQQITVSPSTAQQQIVAVASATTDTSVPTQEPITQAAKPTQIPSPTITPTQPPTQRPTTTPLIFDSNVEGLQPVLGPVNLPSGIYKVTVKTDGFFIASNETVSGTCDIGLMGIFNLMQGQGSSGASTILKSRECSTLFAISNVTDSWTLKFEQISQDVPSFSEIPLKFNSSDEGLMPVLGPYRIPSGTYRVTVTTKGFFIAGIETLNGSCDAGFMGLFNLMQGQASAGASAILKSNNCSLLIPLSNVTDSWALNFEKVA